MTNDFQKVEQAKGRPLLQWVGKHPLESVQYFPAQEKEVYGDKGTKDFNKLFWGDNLQVLSHLLKEYRGEVDLIYIDPPFASAAEYVRSVKLRGERISGVQQGLLEEKQYSDIWEKDEYLQFIYERLLLVKELLSEKGCIYLHTDWHKGAHLKLVMDEVFGEDNLLNEIVWHHDFGGRSPYFYAQKHDILYLYKKGSEWTFHQDKLPDLEYKGQLHKYRGDTTKEGKKPTDVWTDVPVDFENVWDIAYENKMSYDNTGYPTQKPQELLRRIIEVSSNEGDLVADFFIGSGTTAAVAQKLGRRWIGCDINIGAIQTTTKRLNQIITEQKKTKDFKGSLGFKVLNVNDYDVFKNEVEAKEIVMEMYGVEPVKRSYFDGVQGKDFVKVMPMNRVLNKMDLRTVLKSVRDGLDGFTVRKSSRAKEAVYEEGVKLICSGMELDVMDFLKKENNTGVEVQIYDILVDTKNLVFKEYPESKIAVSVKDKKLAVEVKEFYSPILMRKLEIENQRAVKKEHQAKVSDFKQIIDSVAIDVDYNGKLFNAEVIDLPEKNDVIKAKYSWDYPKKGKYTVAIKIVDVLGEEYFETFEVNA